MHLDAVHRLAAKALQGDGIRRSLTTVDWEVAGDCLAPVDRECHSRRSADQPRDATMDPMVRATLAAFPGAVAEVVSNPIPPARHIIVEPGRQGPMRVRMTMRCRKCANCLRLRGRMWSARAIAEYRVAFRNWFGTLTLRPAEHIRLLSLARHKLALQGIDFETLSPSEQFALRHNEISKEITRYLKRLRKTSGAKFRYVCVAEAHVSGLPHYHLLVHELDQFNPVRKSVLDAQWKLGFTCWRLVEDQRKVFYVTKYISKHMMARVRASVRYGTTEGHSFLLKA